MLFSNAPGRSPLHPIRFHPPVARDFHARGEEKPCCALGRATLVGFYDWQRSQVDTGLSSCASRWGVAMATSSGQFDPGGVRVFSGEDEDGKESRRWKVWVTNKLLTLAEKIPKDARGAYVYTMLTGKALEAIEHLEPTEYRCPDGEVKIFQLLDVRFPTKDSADELSENMTKIFELKANEGESLKMWISRAGEAFELLKRKTNVSFPEEARGWMILNRSGLTAEQRAVVLARSLGRLTREEIGKAMRSCYPDYVVPKKKTFGAGVVTDELHSEDPGEEDPSNDFDDVELFLAEGDDEGNSELSQDPFEESEVKEILATTWQEKRRSLNQLQKSRRFHDAGQVSVSRLKNSSEEQGVTDASRLVTGPESARILLWRVHPKVPRVSHLGKLILGRPWWSILWLWFQVTKPCHSYSWRSDLCQVNCLPILRRWSSCWCRALVMEFWTPDVGKQSLVQTLFENFNICGSSMVLTFPNLKPKWIISVLATGRVRRRIRWCPCQ